MHSGVLVAEKTGEAMTDKKTMRCALILLSSFLLAACVFLLCYNYDNKYTQKAPPVSDGVLLLDDAALGDKPVHLVEGWAFYNGVLLTPQDVTAGNSMPFETIYIGQYPGFEAGDKSRSPHGSATYRLQIKLPTDRRSYTLELPEIYSAYRLYINGELLYEMGDLSPESYRPLTGNFSVSFQASGHLEILLAVTDYSGFYSGLTYPPAFGEAKAVSHLLTLRFFIRLLCCAAALLLGLFYLVTGVLSKGSRLSVLYGLMCLCFVGSVCYPTLKTLWASGPWWYAFENFCYAAMLLLVVQIGGRLTKAPAKAMRVAAIVGGVFCLAALCAPLLPGLGLPGMLAYSQAMNLYSWASAGLLALAAIWGVYKNRAYSEIILFGVVFFDCALMMDRLLPAFEPILFGWFTEISGAVLVCCFGTALTRETIRQAKQRLVLSGRVDSMAQLIELQRQHYPVVLESIQQARAARHDLRHHMGLIRELAGEHNMAALTAYLEAYHGDAVQTHAVSYCENYVADTLLRHFAALADSSGIPFEIHVDLPEYAVIPDAELTALLSNLIENALEACAPLPPQDAFIKLSMRLWNGKLLVVVKNSFDGKVRRQGNRFLSRKRQNATGVGTQSVQMAAKTLGGTAEFSAEGTVFSASVVLPIAATTEIVYE